MATDFGATRENAGEGTWTLLCGKDGCEEVSHYTVELVVGAWTAIIGACPEHREDLGLFALRLKEAASR